MHKKHFLVDEAPPVVYPLELEAGLDGHQVQPLHVLLEGRAIARKSFQEEITGIEAQHAEFGIAFVHLLAIPSAVALGEVDGGRKQVVGIERGIEIGVQFEEGFQVVFGVGLPLRIAEQMDTAFGLLAYQQRQLGKYLNQCQVAAGCGDEDILTVRA